MRPAGQATGFVQLRLSDASFFRWRIAKPAIPDGSPDDTEDAEYVEGCAPAVAHLDGHDQQWRDGSPDLGGRQDDAKGAATLGYGKPTGHDGRCIGKGAGFSHPEEETGDEERVVASDQTGKRS